MNIRKQMLIGISLAILVFSTSLVLSWSVTQAVNETRKQVLVRTLANMPQSETAYKQTYQTVLILTMLKCLDSLASINVTDAIDYLVSQQNTTTGNFPADYFLRYGELHTPFRVVNALELFSSSNLLNQTSLVDFVMLRYNETDGAFHEPTFELDGEKIAWCHFSITGKGWGDRDNYGKSNVISTFLAVDILRSLHALNRINITKVTSFILSCKTANGGFGFSPTSLASAYEPNMIPWLAHSFTVDSYGAGVAYTYAAVGALKALNYLDSISSEERQQTVNYILSCQHNRSGCFVSIPEYASDPGPSPEDHDTFFTYYAVMALQYLGAINQTRENIIKAMKWFLTIQNPESGLVYELSPLAGAYYFVMCMNASGTLYLLDELTPRALQQRNTIFGLSATLGVATFTIAVAAPFIVKQARKKMEKSKLRV
ncbi:hypothetical protein KEJ15_03990 [Candidatus Bathyarchaeota archaeon]|nr:hypothetical protein [Candidatus Bathyarchaeota archaeon]